MTQTSITECGCAQSRHTDKRTSHSEHNIRVTIPTPQWSYLFLSSVFSCPRDGGLMLCGGNWPDRCSCGYPGYTIRTKKVKFPHRFSHDMEVLPPNAKAVEIMIWHTCCLEVIPHMPDMYVSSSGVIKLCRPHVSCIHHFKLMGLFELWRWSLVRTWYKNSPYECYLVNFLEFCTLVVKNVFKDAGGYSVMSLTCVLYKLRTAKEIL